MTQRMEDGECLGLIMGKVMCITPFERKESHALEYFLINHLPQDDVESEEIWVGILVKLQ